MGERRFTIIATVRNEADTIRAFADSLFIQSRQPDEIIIVDGASTDGTREILEDYAAHGLLRVISQRCNIAEGRNLGITAATGTHLAVTDAGCKVEADWLAKIERCFESDFRPDVVAGNFRFDTHTRFEEAVVHATFQPNRDQTQTARYYPSSRSVAFTKAAWEKAGGYPEWLYAAEDTLFNIRLRQVGCRFAFCRDAIVHWRPRETWRALARQRINFSRGNARVGVGTAGYLTNLRIHSAIAVLLIASFWLGPLILIALALFGRHVYLHLWPQAAVTSAPENWRMRLRVMAVMEFVRVVNLYGFLLGRWDRYSNPDFIDKQTRYMGVGSASDLDFVDADERKRRPELPKDRFRLLMDSLAVLTVACVVIAWLVSGSARWSGIIPASAAAGFGMIALLAKSLADFSQTGPRIREEVLTHYRRYTLFALSRLSGWAFVIMLFSAGGGVLLYFMLSLSLGHEWSGWFALAAAALGISGAATLQFLRKLRFNPGLLVASTHYRISRFYWLWRWATPGRIYFLQSICIAAVALLLVAASWQLAKQHRSSELIALWAAVLSYAGIIIWSAWLPEPGPSRVSSENASDAPPNILMIGSDTLRADRLSALGYHRPLTPHIDRLAEQGALFANCYVPCARTAPSLISLLTGTWPHTHGIRDNFVADTAHPAQGRCPARSARRPGILQRRNFRLVRRGLWASFLSASITPICPKTSGILSISFGRARRTCACLFPCLPTIAWDDCCCRKFITLAECP